MNEYFSLIEINNDTSIRRVSNITNANTGAEALEEAIKFALSDSFLDESSIVVRVFNKVWYRSQH